PFTAFISRSLSTIENTSAIANYGSAIINAHNYISSQWSSLQEKSSYVAGLTLEAFYNTPFSTSLETELYQFLQTEFEQDSDGVYWTDSVVGYRALGKDVETTANALRMLATIDYGDNANIIQEAIQWIISQQRKWGWYTTADTSAAIQTFIALGDFVSDEITGTVELTVNGLTIDVLEYIDDEDVIVENYNLNKYLVGGVNEITLDRSGNGKVIYYLSVEQVLREELSVNYPDNLEGKPGDVIQIPVNITNPSTEIVPINVNVDLLDESGSVVEGQSQTFSVISTTEMVTFSYALPSIEGKIILKGIQLQYSLADTTNVLSQSNGQISSIFGPLEIEIDQNSVGSLLKISNAQKLVKNSKQSLSQYEMILEKDSM
ncbi:MAG: hypothetical protein ACW99Q_29835, partial [Candidatus Kariarchaeaceae archaeon]